MSVRPSTRVLFCVLTCGWLLYIGLSVCLCVFLYVGLSIFLFACLSVLPLFLTVCFITHKLKNSAQFTFTIRRKMNELFSRWSDIVEFGGRLLPWGLYYVGVQLIYGYRIVIRKWKHLIATLESVNPTITYPNRKPRKKPLVSLFGLTRI